MTNQDRFTLEIFIMCVYATILLVSMMIIASKSTAPSRSQHRPAPIWQRRRASRTRTARASRTLRHRAEVQS